MADLGDADRFDESDIDSASPRVYGPGEPSELEQLPGQFRAFAREMRSSIELLINKVLPKLDRIEEALRDQRERVEAQERLQLDHARELDAHRRRLVQLEAAISKPVRRVARK